jgi:hypothetical protein
VSYRIPSPPELEFVTSPQSASSGQCVAVAKDPAGGRWIRHSQNSEGPAIYYTEDEWSAFLAGAKDGFFD